MLKNEMIESLIDALDEILPSYMDNHQINLLENESIQITDDHGMEVLLKMTESYPAVAPAILVTVNNQTEQIHPLWDFKIYDVKERIKNMMSQFLLPPGPYKKAFGKNGFILSHNAETSKLAGWNPIYTGRDSVQDRTIIKEQLFSRTKGILSREISHYTVLVIGVGSVGSYIAEQFVRNGVESFIFIDSDVVELTNLSRTNYSLGDIGTSKVDALARSLININPDVKISTYEKNVEDFEVNEFAQLIESADLVIAATDDPKAQNNINRFAYAKDKSCLMVGLYKGAKGGEVIISIPEVTPCYLCAAPVRATLVKSDRSETDYGTGRLTGEVALSSDIQHVASAAVKIGLSILSLNESNLEISNFIKSIIAKKYYYLTMSMEDDFWFYSKVFREIEGQYAFQSVWITTESQHDCPVCGAMENRISPEDIPLKAPEVSSPM